MVVDNLNFVRVARTPTKANPPLSIDADSVLPGSVSFQLFQAVRRGYTQVIKRRRGVKHAELPKAGALHVSAQSPDRSALEKTFSVSILEALDHTLTITSRAINVQRYAGSAV